LSRSQVRGGEKTKITNPAKLSYQKNVHKKRGVGHNNVTGAKQQTTAGSQTGVSVGGQIAWELWGSVEFKKLGGDQGTSTERGHSPKKKNYTGVKKKN